ncbi:MAG: tRNA (guanine-N1)-methyltransferase [Phormidesmis sp.]
MPPHASSKDLWQREGAARFDIGNAFFRSTSQTGRDLAVLAALSHKNRPDRKGRALRILDAMTGCGVRPLRYVLEAGADYVWANEGNVDLQQLSTNLSSGLSSDQYRITHQDANSVFFDCYQRRDFYDLIDVDGFGSPMPTLATALWAVALGGLLYLTSTDGRATSGHAPDASLQTYGAYGRSHPAVHEQGLRLLMGLVAQQAAARGLAAQPVFSFYQGEVNRVMVRITRSSVWNSAYYGFLAYCHRCGQFQSVRWKKLGRVACDCSNDVTLGDRPAVSGPMWLGPLHDRHELENMRQQAILFQTYPHPNDPSPERWTKCQLLIETMQAEANLPPYHYPLAEIGRRGKIDIPPKQALISQIQQQGFAATLTHISPQAIKTDAPIAVCIQLAKQLHNQYV